MRRIQIKSKLEKCKFANVRHTNYGTKFKRNKIRQKMKTKREKNKKQK